MNPDVEAAIRAAKAAGEIALASFRTGLAVETKADRSPVTEADRASERKIVEVLRAHDPDCGFLGEESGEESAGARRRWIIDPIDGTKSFVRGIPFFATLIALEEDGELTAGVIYAPATGSLLYGARGQGVRDESGREVRVSGVASLSAAMISFGGLQAFRRHGYWRAFEALVSETARQRGFGDYLGSEMVIRGWSEAMLELDVKPWDLAPLKLLVEEAGGRLTDFTGRATIYGGSALVTNGRIHDAVLDLLREKRITGD
ncbi:MAG: histidinol-phosphatase [Candidatus Binatota bacterium]|nr:histidinol-phosphatase [Candidatus Binatota bacterium]